MFFYIKDNKKTIVLGIFKPDDKDVKSLKKVRNIDKFAFKNTNELKYIKIHSKIKTFSESSFENCENLRTVIISNKDLKKTKKTISKDNFSSKGKDKKILHIQSRAFKNCYELESFVSLKKYKKIVIEKGAFEGCSKLRSVVLLADTVDISEGAFPDCNDLVFIGNNNLERVIRESGKNFKYVEL